MSPSAHVQSDVAITTVGFHVDRSMTLSFQTICQVFSMNYNQSFHQVTCSIQLIGSLFLPWAPLNSYASSIFLEYLHFTEMSYLISMFFLFSYCLRLFLCCCLSVNRIQVPATIKEAFLESVSRYGIFLVWHDRDELVYRKTLFSQDVLVVSLYTPQQLVTALRRNRGAAGLIHAKVLYFSQLFQFRSQSHLHCLAQHF